MPQILLIEDNTDINETTCELLEIACYEVISAQNGVEGFNLAIKHKPDIILCDIWMPEKDGYSVLKSLKENPETANIPFIFLSASTEASEVKMGKEMGAWGYICKPFTEEELLDTIKQVVEVY